MGGGGRSGAMPGSDLVKEGGSCQDHGELTGVVGIVQPGLVVDIPGMKSPRETHNAISGLTPHSARHSQKEETEFSVNNFRLI